MDWVPHPHSGVPVLLHGQSTRCQLSQWARSSQCVEGSVNEAQTWSMGFRGSQWEEESVYRMPGQSIGCGFSEWDVGSYEFECYEYWTKINVGRSGIGGPQCGRQFPHSADWWWVQIIYSVAFGVLHIPLHQDPPPALKPSLSLWPNLPGFLCNIRTPLKEAPSSAVGPFCHLIFYALHISRLFLYDWFYERYFLSQGGTTLEVLNTC